MPAGLMYLCIVIIYTSQQIMATELSDWSLPMCSEIQDGGEVALLEKATAENTKWQLKSELRFLTVSLRKYRNISSNYRYKSKTETFIQTPMLVSRTETWTQCFRLAPKPIVL